MVLILSQEQTACSLVCQLTGSVIIKNQLVKGKHSRYGLIEDSIVLWSAKEDDDEEEVTTSHEQPSSEEENDSNTTNTVPASPRSSTSATTLASNQSQPSPSTQHQPVKILPRGEHYFAFAFDLPRKGLYNSLEFERGSISYVITATFQSPGPVVTTPLTCKKNISIICPIDVSALLPPKPSMLSIEIRKKKRETGIITSMIEIPARGYLRGDSVQVSITVNHVRPVKLVHGVIVTLSRISRVCGGGLELQCFRKDLAQTVSSLITDPSTFSQTISNKLKIPLDVFPTTTGHEMVSFMYRIEAVIDLAGKWNLKMTDDEATSSSRLGFIDTDKLKKNRGVVSLWMDVIIGTERGPGPPSNPSHPATRNQHLQLLERRRRQLQQIQHQQQQREPRDGGDISPASTSPVNGFSQHQAIPSRRSPAYVASEKERLRAMEAALLPSEPSSSSGPHAVATAPRLETIGTPVEEEGDKMDRERRYLETQASEPGSSASASTSMEQMLSAATSTLNISRVKRGGHDSHGSASTVEHEEYEYDVPAYEPATQSRATSTMGQSDTKENGSHLLPSEPGTVTDDVQEIEGTAPPMPGFDESQLYLESEGTAPPMPIGFHDGSNGDVTEYVNPIRAAESVSAAEPAASPTAPTFPVSEGDYEPTAPVLPMPLAAVPETMNGRSSSSPNKGFTDQIEDDFDEGLYAPPIKSRREVGERKEEVR